MSDEQNWETVSMVPDTSMVHAIENDSRHNWRLCLGELIDNAFDAGAMQIEVSFGASRKDGCAFLSVRDNGVGCSNLNSMLVMGLHTPHKTTRSGRYGIGMKEAVIWLGGAGSTTTVHTISAGAERQCRVNWRTIVKARSWDIKVPPPTPADRSATSFMNVCVEPVIRRVPDGKQWDGLLAEIGYLYAPAIRNGRQIIVRRHRQRNQPDTGIIVPGYRLPDLEEEVDRSLSVFGKGVRIHAGIVKAGVVPTRQGLTYSCCWRVIKSAGQAGCGEHSIERIVGQVHLDDSWKLSKNKDELNDERADALFAAVYAVVKPLLIKADEATRDKAQVDLEQELTQFFRGNLRGERGDDHGSSPDAKAKRGDGDLTGTVKPTGTGGRHRRAKREQDGSTFASARGRDLSNVCVKLAPLAEDKGIGYVDTNGRCPMVYLNTTGGMGESIQGKNISALKERAASLLAHRLVYEPGQLKLWDRAKDIEGNDAERFSRFYAALLGRPVAEERSAEGVKAA